MLSLRRTFRLLPWVLALAPLLWAARLNAQSPTTEFAAAEVLFRDGRRLMSEGKLDQACEKLAESQRLQKMVGTLLNLAVCHEKQGRTATAWSEYEAAAAMARRKGDTDRAAFAQDRRSKLEGALSKMTITLEAPVDGLAISIDGSQFDAALLGTALPVDPGKHVVTASAPGMQVVELSVDVPVGPAELTVKVPRLVPEQTNPRHTESGGAPAPTQPSSSPVPVTHVAPESDLSPLVFVGFGLAGAAVVVGAITGGIALATDVDALCPGDRCDAAGREAIDDATTIANVSNVAFAVAGAGAILGVVGIVLSLDSEEEMALVVGPQSIQLTASF